VNKNRPLLEDFTDADTKTSAARLGDQEYMLKTVKNHGHTIALLCGGSDLGALYAAYRFAEHLGVRFYLHVDVIPDARTKWRIPDIDEIRRPLFALRGIQPFHNFPEGPDWRIIRKINCAGRAVGDYEADPSIALQGYDRPRDMPVRDFYADWALRQFGEEVAKALARLFERLDGSSAVKSIGQRQANLPRPSDWRKGPGGVFTDPRSWDDVRKDYDFISEMERLRQKVRGAGNLERFDYWLNQFRYLRAVGKFCCTLHRFNEAMQRVRDAQNPETRKKLAVEIALPIRREQMDELRKIHKYLLNSISTTGGLGTVTNWQQHNIPMLIEKPGVELAALLGEDLPVDAQPPKA